MTKKVKTIKLDNDHTLEIENHSRKIAADTYVVKMKAMVKIAIDEKLFSNKDLDDILFSDVINELGEFAQYEYISERNMVFKKDKDQVFENLVNAFCDNLLQYISKPDFPEKLVLKKYKDKLKKKY